MGMRLAFASLLAVCAFLSFSPLQAGPTGVRVTGKVSFAGSVPKTKPFDLSKEPACIKMREGNPLFPETVLLGPDSGLRNVVVYISTGAPASAPPSSGRAAFDQQGCHYTTHVLAVRVGQEISISNGDPFAHNIHPIARVNREWNKIQPAGTPPFTYAYDTEEFIPVKCNIHPWMQGYFAVLKTAYFAVTGGDGTFSLPELPPGHYTVTAWHESLGTQSHEVTLGAEPQSVNFVFTGKP